MTGLFLLYSESRCLNHAVGRDVCRAATSGGEPTVFASCAESHLLLER